MEDNNITIQEDYLKLVVKYQQVFSTADGKEVLADILDNLCLRNQSSFIPGAPTGTTEFKAGHQNVALKIIEIINQDPEKIEIHIKQLKSSLRDTDPNYL